MTKTTILCKGFAKSRILEDRIMETLWAVLPNGRVFQSAERLFTWSHFHKAGMQWKQVEELPEQVEFIGNYEVPADL